MNKYENLEFLLEIQLFLGGEFDDLPQLKLIHVLDIIVRGNRFHQLRIVVYIIMFVDDGGKTISTLHRVLRDAI